MLPTSQQSLEPTPRVLLVFRTGPPENTTGSHHTVPPEKQAHTVLNTEQGSLLRVLASTERPGSYDLSMFEDRI